MPNSNPAYFHLHLVSDATGETLSAIGKAAGTRYAHMRPIEHIHALVRSPRQLKRALQEIEQTPGIVLYTLVNDELRGLLEDRCRELNVPCVNALQHILQVFESYLGQPGRPAVGGQHVLDQSYFKRIEALNFSMAHDDGRLPEDLDQADIIVLGISRTSKTPTSIYLANRGYKTTNLPLVPGIPLPAHILKPTKAFIVGLVASPERISEIRRNRVMLLADGHHLPDYVDRDRIAAEILYSRRLCQQHKWPVIDVTRRSIEETAATILKLLHDRDEGANADDEST